MKKRYTHVIWDFNGTLYNDVEACIQSANRLLRVHGLSPIASVEAYREIFGFPIIDYYRRMGFDFEKTPYSELAVEWVDYYLEASREATVYPEAIALLEALRARGLSQILLSATEERMLQNQLASLGLSNAFDEVIGQDNIHAYGKEALGRAWRARNPEAEVLFLGDTEHDAAVAAEMGADCILLSCGHQSSARLKACRPLATLADHRLVLSHFGQL